MVGIRWPMVVGRRPSLNINSKLMSVNGHPLTNIICANIILKDGRWSRAEFNSKFKTGVGQRFSANEYYLCKHYSKRWQLVVGRRPSSILNSKQNSVIQHWSSANTYRQRTLINGSQQTNSIIPGSL